MGYGLPASIGSCIAAESTPVLCFTGDGSIQMNIQELQTVVSNNLNLKIIVMNNNGYLSIKSTHENFFDTVFGADPSSGIDFPDFCQIATAYGIRAIKVKSEQDLNVFEELLESPGPALIELMIDPQQEFCPKLKSRMGDDGNFVTPELDDMFPFLAPEKLAGEKISFIDTEKSCLMRTLNETLDPVSFSRPDKKLISNEKDLFVFGTGSFATKLARALQSKGRSVSGFVVSQRNSNLHCGLDVHSVSELTGVNAQVLVGVFNREHPYASINNTLISGGFTDILFPWDFYEELIDELGWQYWLAPPSYLHEHKEDIAVTYRYLSDDESRRVLIDLIRFRMGANIDYSLYTTVSPQYFNELTIPRFDGHRICYVDGGAYDGDSCSALLHRCSIDKAYLFEPDKDNFEMLKQNMASKELECSLLPLALSSEYRTLTFSQGEGEGQGYLSLEESTLLPLRLMMWYSALKLT